MEVPDDIPSNSLEHCSYRYLQQLAKSLNLPSNVKKVYLIEMIYAKKFQSAEQLESIVTRIKEERKQTAKPRKTSTRKKKRVQGTEISSTSNHSPPTSTPDYCPSIGNVKKYKSILNPLIAKRTIESDRVLRSYNNRVRRNTKYSIMNINNTVVGVVKAQNSLSQEVQERQFDWNVELQRYRPVRVADCVIQRQQSLESDYVLPQPRPVYVDVNQRQRGDFETGERQLVPVARSSNVSTIRERRLSGIYPLEPAQSYYQPKPGVGFRRQDGRISKINAVVQKPIRNPQTLIKNKMTQTTVQRRLVQKPVVVSLRNALRPKLRTVQDVVNYKIDGHFSNSSTESARESSTDREIVPSRMIASKSFQETFENTTLAEKRDRLMKTRDYSIENVNRQVQKNRCVEIPRTYTDKLYAIVSQRSEGNKIYAIENPRRTDNKIYAVEHPRRTDNKIYAIENQTRRNDNIYATENQPRCTDNMYVTENQTRRTDNIYATENQTRRIDNMYTKENQTRLTDNMYATENQTRRTDNMYTTENQTGSTDNMYAIENQTICTDNMYATENQTGSTDNMYATENQTGSTDNMYATENQTICTDNMYATENQTGSTDNMYATGNQTICTDNMYATENQTGSTDNMYATVNQTRCTDNVYATENQTRCTDNVYATENQTRLTDNMYATENQTSFTDNMYGKENQTGSTDTMYATENQSGRTDNMYATENQLRTDNKLHTTQNETRTEEARAYRSDNAYSDIDHQHRADNFERQSELKTYAKKYRNTVNKMYTVKSNKYETSDYFTEEKFDSNIDATSNPDNTTESLNYIDSKSENAVDINQNSLTDVNMDRNKMDYPNMSALTDVYPEDRAEVISEALTEPSSSSTVYYHKKIRAEQVRTKRVSATPEVGAPADSALPHIGEVFSQLPEPRYKHSQPHYVECGDDEAQEKCTKGPLESLYNYKSAELDQPLNFHHVIGTTSTTCVYSTHTTTTAAARSPTSQTQCSNSLVRDDRYNMESESMPRLHDYIKMAEQERDDMASDEVLRRSPGSDVTSAPSDLGADVTVRTGAENIEDALELISQDGDYMERIGMDVRMQCILCDWAGPKSILEYHLGLEHPSEIVPRRGARWRWAVRLGGARAGARALSGRAGRLYVLRAGCLGADRFRADISMLPKDDETEYFPKYGRLTVYNKITGEPFIWEGMIADLPESTDENDTKGLNVDLSSLDLLPNSANLKLVNGEWVVQSTEKVVVGQMELNDVEIVVHVQIYD